MLAHPDRIAPIGEAELARLRRLTEGVHASGGEPRDLRDAGQGKSEDAPAEWTAKRDLVI